MTIVSLIATLQMSSDYENNTRMRNWKYMKPIEIGRRMFVTANDGNGLKLRRSYVIVNGEKKPSKVLT